MLQQSTGWCLYSACLTSRARSANPHRDVFPHLKKWNAFWRLEISEISVVFDSWHRKVSLLSCQIANTVGLIRKVRYSYCSSFFLRVCVILRFRRTALSVGRSWKHPADKNPSIKKLFLRHWTIIPNPGLDWPITFPRQEGSNDTSWLAWVQTYGVSGPSETASFLSCQLRLSPRTAGQELD